MFDMFEFVNDYERSEAYDDRELVVPLKKSNADIAAQQKEMTPIQCKKARAKTVKAILALRKAS
jgi:hypothetical protein